jgi:transposase
MRKIEEILRLKYEAGLTHRAIAQSCSVSPSTVSEFVTHAKAAGLSWPLPEGINNEQLNELLFPQRGQASGRNILQPDWAEVHKELRRKSVTLSLLWVEYRQEQPEGYGYSQFCHHYRTWAKQLKPMMRQKHKAGEKLFVDYAGQTMPVVDPKTGEIRRAQIFVATLGASNYTYTEAHWSQDLPNWIGAHVRALAFIGGTPEVLVPDNLKATTSKPELRARTCTSRTLTRHTWILPSTTVWRWFRHECANQKTNPKWKWASKSWNAGSWRRCATALSSAWPS